MISLFTSDHLRRLCCIWGETKEAPHIKSFGCFNEHFKKKENTSVPPNRQVEPYKRFSVPLISKYENMYHYFVRNVYFPAYEIQYAINLHPFSLDIALIEEYRKDPHLL